MLLSMFFIIGCKKVASNNKNYSKIDNCNNFDFKSWKDDRYGCRKVRTSLPFRDLTSCISKYKGHKRSQIEKIIGKPDLIFWRNDTTLKAIYYLEPCNKCSNKWLSKKKLRQSIQEATLQLVYINGKYKGYTAGKP